MESEQKVLTIQDDPSRGNGISVKGMSIRKCNGCVKCVTTNPGKCALDDEFSPIIDLLASHDILRFISAIEDNGFPGTMTKTVERISNILQAYTELGGNIPLETEGFRLNKVEIAAIGEPDDRGLFERNLTAALKMGPIETIVFEYH